MIKIWVGIVLLTLCSIGCSSSNQTAPSLPASTPIPPVTRAVEQATPILPTPKPFQPNPDLSTPTAAFESHLTALRGEGQDIDRYIQTLSKKRIREEVNSPVLNTDATGKKLNTLRERVAYLFRLEQYGEMGDFRLKSEYKHLGEQIRKNSATVWYFYFGQVRVCRLTKEGGEWKIDNHFDFPKKSEETEFFQRK